MHDIIVEQRARLYDIKGGSVHSTRHRSRCYDFIAHVIFTDNCFSFTSTLADTLCSMDVSRYPDSLNLSSRITCHRLVYSYVPVPVLRVSLYLTLYQYGLSTRHRLPMHFPSSSFVLLTRHRLPMYFLSSPFCLIDSSMLTITAYAFPFIVCRLVSRLVILRL